MKCQVCSRDIPDESRFCNACGARQLSADQLKETPELVKKPYKPAGPENDLWSGRFSAKALAHYWLICLIWMTAVAVFRVTVLPPDTASWLIWILLAIGLAPVVWTLWATMVRKVSMRYRLTSHRLFLEHGLIRREMSEVELIRVDDVSVSQNILQRIFNVGSVTVISTDASDPRAVLNGIEAPIKVKEMIRTAVQKWRVFAPPPEQKP
jgi:membrane protein YdbS with pleckstrin-like domain